MNEVGVAQTGADMSVPDHLVQPPQQGIEARILGEESCFLGEAQLASAMGSTQGADDVVAPHLLQAAVGHQPAVAIGTDPAAGIQREPAFGDQQVQVGMPLQIAAKGMQHGHDAQAHAMLLPRPLRQGCGRGTKQEVQSYRPIEAQHATQMGWDGEHEMMVRHVEQIVEHVGSPTVCGVLSTGGTEAGLAGMRYDLDALTPRTGVKMATQGRCTAGDDLAHRLEDDRADTLAGRTHERIPMRLKQRRDPVPNLRANGQHQTLTITVDPTAVTSAQGSRA